MEGFKRDQLMLHTFLEQYEARHDAIEECSFKIKESVATASPRELA